MIKTKLFLCIFLIYGANGAVNTTNFNSIVDNMGNGLSWTFMNEEISIDRSKCSVVHGQAIVNDAITDNDSADETHVFSVSMVSNSTTVGEIGVQMIPGYHQFFNRNSKGEIFTIAQIINKASAGQDQDWDEDATGTAADNGCYHILSGLATPGSAVAWGETFQVTYQQVYDCTASPTVADGGTKFDATHEEFKLRLTMCTCPEPNVDTTELYNCQSYDANIIANWGKKIEETTYAFKAGAAYNAANEKGSGFEATSTFVYDISPGITAALCDRPSCNTGDESWHLPGSFSNTATEEGEYDPKDQCVADGDNGGNARKKDQPFMLGDCFRMSFTADKVPSMFHLEFKSFQMILVNGGYKPATFDSVTEQWSVGTDALNIGEGCKGTTGTLRRTDVADGTNFWQGGTIERVSDSSVVEDCVVVTAIGTPSGVGEVATATTGDDWEDEDGNTGTYVDTKWASSVHAIPTDDTAAPVHAPSNDVSLVSVKMNIPGRVNMGDVEHTNGDKLDTTNSVNHDITTWCTTEECTIIGESVFTWVFVPQRRLRTRTYAARESRQLSDPRKLNAHEENPTATTIAAVGKDYATGGRGDHGDGDHGHEGGGGGDGDGGDFSDSYKQELMDKAIFIHINNNDNNSPHHEIHNYPGGSSSGHDGRNGQDGHVHVHVDEHHASSSGSDNSDMLTIILIAAVGLCAILLIALLFRGRGGGHKVMKVDKDGNAVASRIRFNSIHGHAN